MLYLLLAPLRGQFPLFNVLRYPSFRAVSAFLLALAICIVLGPRFISWLQQQKFVDLSWVTTDRCIKRLTC
jgi:phospho-N-acetylmuramoyl-pentapeptide-transferase